MKSRGLTFLEIYGFALAGLLLLPPMLWPDSTIAQVAMYVASAYIVSSLLLKARAGYRRRLPYWTAESWRRFFAVCAVSAAALLISICMAAAVEFKLPVAGAPQSGPRTIWVGFMMALLVVGAGGLTGCVFWLSEGEASEPFTLFQKRSRA